MFFLPMNPERERGFRQHQDTTSAAAPPAPREGKGVWGDEGTSALGRDPVKTLHLRGGVVTLQLRAG
jgi:hypothetical protein